MHRRGAVLYLSLLVFVAAVHPAAAREPEVANAPAPATFHVVIERGAPRVTASPSSLSLTTGWRRQCVLELENRDSERREIRIAAERPLSLSASDSVITLGSHATRSVRVLLQTLGRGDIEGRLLFRSGSREAAATIRVASRPESAGLTFGAIDHFEMNGPIQAMDRPATPAKQAPPGGKPPRDGKPGGPGLPPKPGGEKPARGEKDLSHLTVAPGEAIGERILEAMRPIQDLGAQTYRLDLSWRIVEHTSGVFAWDRMDWMTKALASPNGAGAGIIAQIGYQPTWLPADFPRTNAGREAYARWVEAVVSRYADRVDCWELWNEPLLFWLQVPKAAKGPGAKARGKSAPQPAADQEALVAADVQMMLDVIKIASPIIRRLDPGATILSPAIEDFTAIGGTHADFAQKVYSQLLRQDLASYLDGVCVHSYPAGFPASAPKLGDAAAWRRFDQSAEEGLLGWVRRQNVDLPLYCTEFGGFAVPRNAGSETETAVALALLRNGCILADHGFRSLTYYQLYDWDPSLTYLVRHADGHRTRGFTAYQALISALSGAIPTGGLEPREVRNADPEHSGVAIKGFRRGPEDIVCLWSNATAPRTVRFRGRSSSGAEEPVWEHLRFSPRGTFLSRKVWDGDAARAQDVDITVAPLEFHILSRTMSRPGRDRLVPWQVSEPANP